MAEKTLEEMRSDLIDAFEQAVEYGRRYVTSSIGPENLKAAAEIAKAVVAIDDKLDARKEAKDSMKLPGK